MLVGIEVKDFEKVDQLVLTDVQRGGLSKLPINAINDDSSINSSLKVNNKKT